MISCAGFYFSEKARETDDELRSITSVNGTVKVHVPTKESEAVNGGAIGEHL